MLLLIDAVSTFPVRKVLFWTVPISNYSIIKQRICRNYMPFNAQMPHPLEAFECFSLPYSDVLQAQLITSKHAYTQMKTKGGISQDAAEQHAAGQTVYDKLAIVIQSKNPYHPYIELDFSNHTAVSAMWKSLQTSSILENIFETETKFSISYAGCDTDIKIRKRFSAIPSLPFALTSIGPAQLNMLNQTLLHLEAIAQANLSDSAPVS